MRHFTVAALVLMLAGSAGQPWTTRSTVRVS